MYTIKGQPNALKAPAYAGSGKGEKTVHAGRYSLV